MSDGEDDGDDGDALAVIGVGLLLFFLGRWALGRRKNGNGDEWHRVDLRVDALGYHTAAGSFGPSTPPLEVASAVASLNPAGDVRLDLRNATHRQAVGLMDALKTAGVSFAIVEP